MTNNNNKKKKNEQRQQVFISLALFQLWSKCFIVYHYPDNRIQNQFCTQNALSPLPGEHSNQSPFYRRAQCQLNRNTVHILPGSHFTPGLRATMWIHEFLSKQESQWKDLNHPELKSPPIHNPCFLSKADQRNTNLS